MLRLLIVVINKENDRTIRNHTQHNLNDFVDTERVEGLSPLLFF